VKFFKISEVSIFTIPRTHQISATVEQETDPRSSAHSAVILHNIRVSANYVKRLAKCLHEYFRISKHTFYSATHSWTFSWIRQSLSCSEVLRVKSFYLIPQHGEQGVGPYTCRSKVVTCYNHQYTRKSWQGIRDKVILYWFEPLECKTIRPVLRFVLMAWRDYMASVVNMEVVCP
jgi:hypothetical protein